MPYRSRVPLKRFKYCLKRDPHLLWIQSTSVKERQLIKQYRIDQMTYLTVTKQKKSIRGKGVSARMKPPPFAGMTPIM